MTYTEEDVKALTIHAFGAAVALGSMDVQDCRRRVVKILDWLAAAGRLVPAEAEIIEQWGLVFRWPDRPDEPRWFSSREAAVQRMAERQSEQREYAHLFRLVHRSTLFMPTEVVDEPEGQQMAPKEETRG